ncbi:hypothetical protein DU472_04375 [Campylobacter novaezeelandiae]|nr:hypothetical protein DU472_04375 [Campylobacter novaezeelandiae]
MYFLNKQKNRNKLIKILISNLYFYSQAKNNQQKIQILIKIYKTIDKYNKNPEFSIENIDFKKEDIFEELFYLLGNINNLSIKTIQARIARFIKTLGGEPIFYCKN